MPRPKRNAASRAVKKEETTPTKIKIEPSSPSKRKRTSSTAFSPPPADVKSLPSKKPRTASPSTKPTPKTNTLLTKKQTAYNSTAGITPFPSHPHPTDAEAKLAHRILISQHGARIRPATLKAPTSRSGCGDSPSVLDALVRTILSQNTSDTNSTRAKRSMDAVYGRSDAWEAIAAGGQAKLQDAITCGGLAKVKSRVILSILEQAKEKYGEYSLDHLHSASDEDAMREMLGFQGVGPKTASCVLLFCLQRDSFAVDTHVWRISKLLGWVPKTASRDETHAHLDVRIPDEDKYGLHILMVGHGKVCDECKAGGKNTGKCELRRAFRKGKMEGEAGEEMKIEEIKEAKKEENSKKDKKIQGKAGKLKKEE